MMNPYVDNFGMVGSLIGAPAACVRRPPLQSWGNFASRKDGHLSRSVHCSLVSDPPWHRTPSRKGLVPDLLLSSVPTGRARSVRADEGSALLRQLIQRYRRHLGLIDPSPAWRHHRCGDGKLLRECIIAATSGEERATREFKLLINENWYPVPRGLMSSTRRPRTCWRRRPELIACSLTRRSPPRRRHSRRGPPNRFPRAVRCWVSSGCKT
jgi:hypothetical protein